MRFFGFFLVVLLSPALLKAGAKPQYVGQEVCGACHREIAATQRTTAMANTWQAATTNWLPAAFEAQAAESPAPEFLSLIQRTAEGLRYQVRLSDHQSATLPVEAMVGGQRHGLGFLTRVSAIGGEPLPRPVLEQARYAWSFRENRLVLAPGCPEAKPISYQTAFGLSLGKAYEDRCLTCHGKPHTLGAGQRGGVGCESCHGPGSDHLRALANGGGRGVIINPKKLDAEGSIAVCAGCHVGLTKVPDPSPEDLLVANQVVALKASECFRQSANPPTCTTCHNPHQDEREGSTSSAGVCLGCHSAGAVKPHAAVCPVDQREGCLGCHMPAVDIGPFHLVDHWIRVHPEQGNKPQTRDGGMRSQLEPLREFLQSTSGDKTIDLGDQRLADLPGPLAEAARKLNFGQSSSPIQVNGESVLLTRRSRDFRWRAQAWQAQAQAFADRGEWTAAFEANTKALVLYPRSRTALVAKGNWLASRGSFRAAEEALRKSAEFYPDDANGAFHLGRVLGKEGRREEAIAAYRKAIANDPDYISAYLNLGRALMAGGQLQEAVASWQAGVDADPLRPDLYEQLSAAYERLGDSAAAAKAKRLATAIEARH